MKSELFGSLAGRSVFVTGHTGFKGSWLCLWLERLGATVTGYAMAPPTQPSNFVVSNVRDCLTQHHEADIRDESRLHAALQEAQPDLVLHLAAQSVVRDGYRLPRETFEVNVIGTACVLDGVRKLGRPCSVVCVTSDKCYENREQIWGYREEDALGDHDPYGGSKGAAEILIRTYRHSFFPPDRLNQHGVKLASVRAGNVIGGGDWTRDALVVDIVKALSEGRPVALRSPGSCRPWQHVLQALSGYLTLADRLLDSDSEVFQSGWNIGPLPSSQITVQEVAEEFIAEWGAGSWKDVSGVDRHHEAKLLHLSIDKAMRLLDWQPAWSVQEAIRQTARWYRRYFEADDEMRQLCLEQIQEYESTCWSAPNLKVGDAI